MSKVIKIADNYTLAHTSDYPYASWDFDKFNPIQTRLLELYETNCNIAVAASTSAGKTVSSEIFMARDIRKKKGKCIYVGPLKALCKQNQEDWTRTEHHFHDLNISIATGDNRLTVKRIKEMDEADIVVMTPEMLASRSRNHKSDKSRFLNDVSCVVFDEAHLLTVPNRGDHIEVALMKLTDINPDVRIVLLSATMPNVDEICGWVSDITGRDTYYLESEYRPCPLGIHYENYYDGDKQYWEKEAQKVATACAIVEHYPNDKFLIFAHGRETGTLMVKHLAKHKINAEFHNSTKSLAERVRLEDSFKNDKNFRVLVATSGLAWGINAPARRVIVLGLHRGLSVVENYDIKQMIGRSGRPRFDPRGDAYILVPESERDHWIKVLKTEHPIRSTLLNFVGKAENPHYKVLAFHIVAEIHQGNVRTKDGFKEWFRNSLAHFQDHAFDDQVIERTIELLEQCKAVVQDDGEYQCTAVGKIASMFYYSPFDVSDLRRNFKFLFEEKKDHDDYIVSLCFGNIDSHRWTICNKFEKEAIAEYQGRVEKMFGRGKFTDGALKVSAAYYYLLKGRRDIPAIESLQGVLVFDLERTMQVLNAIDSMSCKWDRQNWLRVTGLRVRYGVEPDIVELCQIPNIKAARAKKLKSQRIKTIEDFLNYDAKTLAAIMKVSERMAEESLEGARLVKLKESLI